MVLPGRRAAASRRAGGRPRAAVLEAGLAPIPSGAVAWSDPRLRGAWAVLGIGAVLGIALLPHTFVVSDEVFYAGQARALLEGHLLPEPTDPLPVASARPEEAARYPIGWPLLLAPLAALGIRPMFLASLAVHLLGGAAVARMLVRRGVPAWLAALYLFHPVTWPLSRTLMSDAAGLALLMLSMDAWEGRAPGKSGALLGYSVLVRIANVIAGAGLGLAILAERPRFRKLLRFAAWPVAAGVGLLVMNSLVLGSPLGAWYGERSVPLLTGRMFLENLLLYTGGLLLLPPWPLACLALRRGACDRWALAAIPVLAFFLLYSYHDVSTRWVETFVGGQRLIVAAHAVLLVSTARVWAALPLFAFRRLALGAAVGAALVASLLLRRLEDRFTPAIGVARMCRPETIAYNEYAGRVALAVEAREYRLVGMGRPVPRADLIVLTTSLPTRNPAGDGAERFVVPLVLRSHAARCQAVGQYLLFDMTGRCPPPRAPCAL